MQTVTISPSTTPEQLLPILAAHWPRLQSDKPINFTFAFEPVVEKVPLEQLHQDEELLEIVRQIQALGPTPPEHITPATETFTEEEIAAILAEEPLSEEEQAKLNAEWDAYEAQMKREYEEDERKMMEDLRSLFGQADA